jgi:ABC-type transporter Mla subunit MlaD
MDAYEDRSFRTNFAVGLMVVLLLAGLAAVATFFLSKESPLTRTYPLRVRFADVAGLKTGAPVTLMGAAVGRVEAMIVAAPEPPRFPGSSWLVELAVRDEPWIRERLTTASTFAVQPESVFGNKYVNATFGDGGTPLAPGAVVEGAVGAGIDARTFDKLSLALENLSGAAAELRSMLASPPAAIDGTVPKPAPNLKEVVANLDETLRNTSEASRALKEALTDENQAKMKQTFDDLSTSAKNLANVTERMKTSMDSWGETMDRMRFWRGWFGDGRKPDEKKGTGRAER